MINYNKNDLINECLFKYYETFAHTLDTADYVPEQYNMKILAYIFKNMKKQFKKIDRADKQFQKQLRAQQKKLQRGENNVQSEEQAAEENSGENQEEQAAEGNGGENQEECAT